MQFRSFSPTLSYVSLQPALFSLQLDYNFYIAFSSTFCAFQIVRWSSLPNEVGSVILSQQEGTLLTEEAVKVAFD